MRALVVLCVALAGCGAADPCDGHAGACLSLRVESGGGVGQVDQLAVQLSGAAQLDGRTPGAPGAPVSLPIATAIYLPAASGAVAITVVGLRGGATVGQGAGAVEVRPNAHVTATVALMPLGSGGGEDLAIGGGDPDLAVGGNADLAFHDLAGTAPRYIFLLAQHTSNLGAQSGLDTECIQAAANAGLPGSSYKVVIAYPTSSPSSAIILGAGRAIIRPDTTVVATDSTFWTTSHLAPIDQLANGQVADGCVFTDFSPTGDKIPASTGDCTGWTGDPSGTAYVGDSSQTDINWNFSGTQSCTTASCYLYCIQQ